MQPTGNGSCPTAEEVKKAVDDLADVFAKIDAVYFVSKNSVFSTFETATGGRWMVDAAKQALIQRIASRSEELAQRRIQTCVCKSLQQVAA